MRKSDGGVALGGGVRCGESPENSLDRAPSGGTSLDRSEETPCGSGWGRL